MILYLALCPPKGDAPLGLAFINGNYGPATVDLACCAQVLLSRASCRVFCRRSVRVSVSRECVMLGAFFSRARVAILVLSAPLSGGFYRGPGRGVWRYGVRLWVATLVFCLASWCSFLFRVCSEGVLAF